MVQRPQDWSKKVANSPFILRRGLNHVVAKEKAKKDIDKETVKAYRHQFSSIYKIINQNSGEELYSKLNEILHVDDYLRWLALNYIIKNGDYSDELYFYIDSDTKRFKIIPWDYDDVFQQGPHEGMEVWRSKMDPNSLIFSSEDELDVAIAHDPFLYEKYKQHLTEVIKEFSVQKVESVINLIYEDLSPLFTSDAILQASSKDGYVTSIERLQVELKMVDQYFSYVRGTMADK
jgi:spore coat protein H